MPLSDAIRSFMQEIGKAYDSASMTPEEREQRRQYQQSQAEHQREFGIGQSNTDRAFEEQKRQHKQMMDAKMLEYNYEPVLDGQQGLPSIGGPSPQSTPTTQFQDINSLMEKLIPGFGQLTSQAGGAGAATQQGGPGLNATAPTMGEQPGPVGTPRQPPSSQDSMTSLMPLMSMLMPGGGQGQTGAGVNTTMQMPGGMPTPSNRIAPTSGGVTSPAEQPHVIDFGGGVKYQKRAATDDTTKVNIPPQFRSLFGGQDVVDFKDPAMARQVQSEFIKDAAGSTKEPTKDVGYMETAAQQIAKAHNLTGGFKRPNDLPLELQDEAWAKHNELAAEKPSDPIAKQQKQLEVDKLKREADDYTATNSPQALGHIVDALRDSPDYREQIKDPKTGIKVDLEWQRQTGLPPPIPLKGKSKDEENTARTTQNALNRVLRLLDDPDVQGANRIGPMLGRIGESEQTIGDTYNKLTDKQKAKIQTLRGDLNYLYFQEGKNIFGAKIPFQLIKLLKSTAPQTTQVLPMLYGSTQSVQDYINNRMYSADQARFGNKVRPWKYNIKNNLVAGQMLKVPRKDDPSKYVWRTINDINPSTGNPMFEDE